MARRAGTAGRAVKKASRKAAKTRRAQKAARKSSRSKPSVSPVDDLQKQLELHTRERDEALERQAAMAEVLRIISSSPGDLEAAFQVILGKATRLCDAKFGVVFKFEADQCHAVAMLNVPAALKKFIQQRGTRPPLPGTALDLMFRTKQVDHSIDNLESAHPSPPAKLGGARTHLAVPMLKGDRLIGALTIYRQEVRPFTDKQIDLVQNFAAQAVVAIENARLLNELRERTDDLAESLEQQTATSEVLEVISSAPGELEPVFEAMLENGTRICEAAFGTLLLAEGDAFRRVALHNAPSAFLEFSEKQPLFYSYQAGPVDQIVKTKRPACLAPLVCTSDLMVH